VALLPGGIREQDNDTQRPRGFLEWAFTVWHCPVVPVWGPQELALFHVWKPGILAPVREWGERKLRISLGTFFWPRFPPVGGVTIRVGDAVDPRLHGTVDSFVAAYWRELERLQKL